MKYISTIVSVLILVIVLSLIGVGFYFLYQTTSGFSHLPKTFYVSVNDDTKKYLNDDDSLRLEYDEYTTVSLGYIFETKNIDYSVKVLPCVDSTLDYAVGGGIYDYKKAGDFSSYFIINKDLNSFQFKPKMHVDTMLDTMYFSAKLLKVGYLDSTKDILGKKDIYLTDMFTLEITNNDTKAVIKLDFSFRVNPTTITLEPTTGTGGIVL